MFYPMKFQPVYKDYIWGGRNLEKVGKKLPDGRVAESWELSCHPNGLSVVKNGVFTGRTLQSVIDEYKTDITGSAEISEKHVFPLLVKLIDANDRLSVQVHPDDEYALANEREFGKNEMWYIIDAKPDASIIYDIKPNTTREGFENAIKEDRVEDCLQIVPVKAGDFINIPAGTVHAIGKGILLAEIQQNSNSTYRIYDYRRTDASGNQRPLHLNKAMAVISFNEKRKSHYEGLCYNLPGDGKATVLTANQYFCVELFEIAGELRQTTQCRQFHIYICIEGEGKIQWGKECLPFDKGETLLVPSALEHYSFSGSFKALKAYLPDLDKDIFVRLQEMGFSKEEITGKISGLLG